MAHYKQQAGCVPIAGSRETLRVMLITNKKGSHWVLPKGSIKSGELNDHAAWRETKEEVKEESITNTTTTRAEKKTNTGKILNNKANQNK
jgi:ADP-ribose pyrophosphatase YjhB (NUDIX family)